MFRSSNCRALGVSVAVCLFLSAPLRADVVTLDFEGLAFTAIVAGTFTPDPASVLTNDFQGDGIMFGRAGVSAGVAVVENSFAPSSGVLSVAGLDAAGDIPGTVGGASVGDIFFNFVVKGTNTLVETDLVSFSIGDSGGDLDIFDIRAYDLDDNLLSDQHFAAGSRFFVSLAFPGIHRVEVDFTGDFGYSLDDLTFNAVAIPVPGAALLGMMGMGMVGWMRRRLS